MSLQGQLSDMSFGDLFAIITSQPRTGLLRLSNQEFRADLYVHNGQPHRAVIERITDGQPRKGLSGADAVHLMSTWQDGYFDYITLVTLPGERNIFLDKRELMLENIFKKEVFYQPPTTESANVTSYGVHTVTGYRSKVAQLDLSVTEWSVLLQVDDQGDVGMIARQAGLKVPTTWQTLKQLEKFGLVRFSQPAPAVAKPSVKARPVIEPSQPRVQARPQLAFAGVGGGSSSRRGLIGTIMSKLRGL